MAYFIIQLLFKNVNPFILPFSYCRVPPNDSYTFVSGCKTKTTEHMNVLYAQVPLIVLYTFVVCVQTHSS